MDAAILQALEKIRCPFLDVFFAIFTALGEELVIAAIIAIVYICFSKRTGEQALLTVMTASCDIHRFNSYAICGYINEYSRIHYYIILSIYWYYYTIIVKLQKFTSFLLSTYSHFPFSTMVYHKRSRTINNCLSPSI